MCPTCLKVVSLSDLNKISEAHILPKFSGGRLKTYLCSDCNSKFGTNQDKWLGEYLQLRKSGKTVFGVTKQAGRFSINGIPVSGKFRESSDGGLQFYIWDDKTSPESIDQLDGVGKHDPLTLSVEVPLMKNTRLVEVGLLTAAYLLWFRELGYSWVFQTHLDTIRKQICDPTKKIIETLPIAKNIDGEREMAWIGVVEFDETVLAAAGIADNLVLLPTFSNPNVEEVLAVDRGKTVNSTYQTFRFSDRHEFGLPFGIIYKERGVVASHKFSGADFQYGILRYDGINEEPVILHPIDEAEYARLSKEHTEAIHFTISPESD